MLRQLILWICKNPNTVSNIFTAGQFIKQELDEFNNNQQASETQSENEICISAKDIQKVNDIIARVLNINKDSITEHSTFANLGADSLDVVELVMEFEKEYNITIPDELAEKIGTVGDVYRLASLANK